MLSAENVVAFDRGEKPNVSNRIIAQTAANLSDCEWADERFDPSVSSQIRLIVEECGSIVDHLAFYPKLLFSRFALHSGLDIRTALRHSSAHTWLANTHFTALRPRGQRSITLPSSILNSSPL